MAITTPTAYWKLEDLTDSIGAVTDLTNNNTATFAAGKVGNAVNLVRASNQFLSHASTTTLQITGDASWACWVNMSVKTPGDRVIFHKGDSNVVRDYTLYYQIATDRFGFQVNGSNNLLLANTFGSPSTSTSYFIACTWTEFSKTQAISVNNGTVDSSVEANGSVTTTVDFIIGGYTGSGTNAGTWDGWIDELGFWKGHVLTAAEITELYNGGAGRTYPFPGATASDDLSGYGLF